MESDPHLQLDVAILGGGFTGVYCAKTLVREFGKDSSLRVGLISEENYMVFQPMLPEVVSASISPRHVINPLRQLCPGALVYKGRVEAIRLPERTLSLNAGPFTGNVEIGFNQLVLALGAAIDVSRIPGMPEHAFLMQNVGDAMRLRSTIISRIEEANLEHRQETRRRLLTFVVVGGGYSGVETAGQILDLFRSIHRFYPTIDENDLHVILVHSREHLLPTLSRRLGEYAALKLRERGLKLVLNRRVRAVTASHVYLDDHSSIESHTVICTVGTAPHPLVSDLCTQYQLPTLKGRIEVDVNCRVHGHPDLWAAGDCAAVPMSQGGYAPDTAQFAMRQGALMAKNIARAHRGQPLRPFEFKGFGELASIGHYTAVADLGGFQFSGFVAWWLWRTIYVAKLPRFDRKMRVILDWTLDLFFPRDINLLSPRYSTVLKEVHLEPGDYLFREGEPAFSFYIVKHGRLAVSDDKGVIRVVTAGEFFGERALLNDRTWHFDGRALESTTLVSVPGPVFHQVAQGAGSLARLFERSASRYYSRDIIHNMTQRLSKEVQGLSAGQIMCPEIVSLRPDMSVREVLMVTRENPHSCYPVMEGGKVLGVAHRDDIYELLKRHDTAATTSIKQMTLSQLPALPVAATVQELVETLERSGENKVLIEDQEGNLAGIVTVMDLLNRQVDATDSKTV